MLDRVILVSLMNGLFNIIRTTADQARREPVYYILTGIFAALVFASQYIVMFVFEGKTIAIMETGVASITACGILLSLLLSWRLIRKEMEEMQILSILSKPVSRFSFVAGKYLGICFATTMAMFFLFIVFLLTLWVYDGSLIMDQAFSGERLRGTGVLSLSLDAFGRVCSVFFQERILPVMLGTGSALITVWLVMAVCSVSSLFLDILSTTGITLTFMILASLSGNMFYSLQEMGFPGSLLGWIVHLTLPDLSRLNIVTDLQLNKAPGELVGYFLPFLMYAMLSAVLYIGCLLAAGTALFQRKEIT